MAHNPSETSTHNRRFILKNAAVITRLSIITVSLIFILCIASCSSVSNESKGYATAGEALADYESFSSRLSKMEAASATELADIANSWRSIGDSASIAIVRDTTSITASVRFTEIDDSIRASIERLIDSKPRTLANYLVVIRGANLITLDARQQSLVESTHRFYESMDTVPTYGIGNVATVKAYDKMLEDAATTGLSSKADAMAFLKEEDRAFRSFLGHLPTLGDIPLMSIRDKTYEAMGSIVELADGEHPELTTEEAVILLTMRNNRRLIQNAVQCINDINNGKIKPGNTDQCAAYMWMLLQPWLSFDGFAYATMSETQMRSMRDLAVETPKAITKMRNPPFPISIDELPSLLIKTYILGDA